MARAAKPKDQKVPAVVQPTTAVAGKLPVGRPSDYNPEIATILCQRLAEGRSLNSISTDDDMPSKATVLRWLAIHEPFRSQYADARVLQADAIFDECLDIVDDARNDWMERVNKNGETEVVPNPEATARSRLRLDARKWMAGKLAPKKYGEKVTQELTGPNGETLNTGPSVVVFQLPDNGRS